MKVLKIPFRLYINDLNSALKFYEELLGSPASMRFKIPQIGRELAQIESIVLIASPEL
mgnify:CR=1 FL=1